MDYRIEFNISSIIVVLFLYFVSRFRHQIHNIRTRLIYAMMLCNVLTAVSDIIIYNVTPLFPNMPYGLVVLVNYIGYLAGCGVPVAIFYYNYYLIRPYMHERIYCLSPYLFPYYLFVAGLNINLFYPLYYKIGYDLQRYNQNGIYLIYAVVLFYLVMTIVMIVQHTEQMDGRKLFATFLYMGVSLCGRLEGIFSPDIPIDNFCISLTIAIMILIIQNTDEMLDEDIGVLNRGCFKEDMTWRIDEQKSFHLLYLYLDGFSDYRDMLSSEQRKQYCEKIAEILNIVRNEHACYRLLQEVFVVVYESGEEEAAEQGGREFLLCIKEYFPTKSDTGMVAHISIMNYPLEVETLEDMLSAGDFLMNQLKYYPDAVIPKEKIEIQKQKQKVQLGKHILEILQNNAYEICYQPVYDRKKNMITGACARVYLHDQDTFGYEEYAGIYSHLQGVLMFEDKMFADVCEMIQKSDTISNGREFIEVAFSDTQFMQGDFVDKILKTLKHYEISPERIRLCITEPVLASMNAVIENNLHELAEAGISFSLVNYGTGQSNFDRLNRLTFDTVEFDDKLVSTEDFNSRDKEIILKAQLEALHRFGKKIRIYIGEGENSFVNQLSSDYVRAEAVPAEQFAAMLQKQTAIRAVNLI